MELAVRDPSIIAQQVGQLAAATSHLVFQAFCTQTSMVESFQHPSGFSNLRQLEIAKRTLALRDVVALLGALLGLVHLSCPLSMAHGCTNITDMGNRLSQLCPNTSSLNKSFRRWEMQIGAHVSVEYLAFGAMLIAALCPNFCLVRLSQDIRAAFKREIAWAVSVAPFQQYTAHIQSLTLDTGNAREKLGAGMDI
ncbi:hypothetical protein GGF44_002231 [Coemansia sp. RSA 1694]|nr:hypothetical protein GGF44_002231 [Coemansia sp. RSA 1694]